MPLQFKTTALPSHARQIVPRDHTRVPTPRDFDVASHGMADDVSKPFGDEADAAQP